MLRVFGQSKNGRNKKLFLQNETIGTFRDSLITNVCNTFMLEYKPNLETIKKQVYKSNHINNKIV